MPRRYRKPDEARVAEVIARVTRELEEYQAVLEAAAIYGAGWAPEVWLARPSSPAEEAALARLGLALEFEDVSWNRAVPERLGVAPLAIRTLTPGVRNTVEELRLVAGSVSV